jgi:hypothetical protein
MIYALAAFNLFWGIAIGWTLAHYNRKLPGIYLIQPDLEVAAAVALGGVIAGGMMLAMAL